MASPPKVWLIAAGRRGPIGDPTFRSWVLDAAVSITPVSVPDSTFVTTGFNYSGGLLTNISGQSGILTSTLTTPENLPGNYLKFRIKAKSFNGTSLGTNLQIYDSGFSGWLFGVAEDPLAGHHFLFFSQTKLGSGVLVATSTPVTITTGPQDLMFIDNRVACGFYVDGVPHGTYASVLNQTGGEFGAIYQVQIGAANRESFVLAEVWSVINSSDAVPALPPRGDGLPASPITGAGGVIPGTPGLPTLVFAALYNIQLAGIPSGQALGSPLATPGNRPIVLAGIPSAGAIGSPLVEAAASISTALFHFDGSLLATGDITPLSDGGLVSSPTKFGSGASNGFSQLFSNTTSPAISGDFCLDFQIFIATGADPCFAFFGVFELNMFSNAGDVFGDYAGIVPSVNAAAPTILFDKWPDLAPIKIIGPTGSPTLNTFNHVEISRTSGVWHLFLNGVLLGSATDTTVVGEGNQFTMFAPTGSAFDEVRIQYGGGGHTSNFTPPTAPY